MLVGASCAHDCPLISLPAPPVANEAAFEEVSELVLEENLNLILWLDRVERYFAGLECALLVTGSEDTSCAYE